MRKKKSQKWVVFEYYHYNKTGSHKRYSYCCQATFDRYLANVNNDENGEYRVIYRADNMAQASQYFHDIQSEESA